MKNRYKDLMKSQKNSTEIENLRANARFLKILIICMSLYLVTRKIIKYKFKYLMKRLVYLLGKSWNVDIKIWRKAPKNSTEIEKLHAGAQFLKNTIICISLYLATKKMIKYRFKNLMKSLVCFLEKSWNIDNKYLMRSEKNV